MVFFWTRAWASEALIPAPHDQAEPSHKIIPYLLRGMAITRPSQVWAMNISHPYDARLFGALSGTCRL